MWLGDKKDPYKNLDFFFSFPVAEGWKVCFNSVALQSCPEKIEKLLKLEIPGV